MLFVPNYFLRGELMRIKLVISLVIIAFLLAGCTSNENSKTPSLDFGLQNENKASENTDYVIPEGTTIKTRYAVPKGFKRLETEKDSFEEFLRNQKLKPYGEKSLYYNGKEKPSSEVYDSVIDVNIGDKNLHQCADAVMLLRAEYLYSVGKYDEIKFNFVSGFKAEYKKWMEGYRIKVDGNNVSYYESAEPSDTYESFRRFMDVVFAYSSTLSLEKELDTVKVDEMKIGDVFIVGGSPGHAVIIVDMAVDDAGGKIFILAQSYMPAQQTQILINPNDETISPWYSSEIIEKLITPEWTFKSNELRRFR